MQLIPSYNSFVNNDYTRFSPLLRYLCKATATAHKNKTAKRSTTNGYENYNYFL